MEQSLARYDRQFPAAPTQARQRHQRHSYRALRCNVLRGLPGEGFGGMSRRLAECPLFRWFCGMEALAAVRVPGKSTLQDYAHWLPVERMRPLIEQLIRAAQAPEGACGLELANALELERVWLDSTRVKTPLHFPVDWVLLCDAGRTLMKATRLIRAHGLKQRMEPPEQFLKAMNRLSLRMTPARRATDSKKQRQQTLRLMKRQVKVAAAHARRHRQLRDEAWEQTDWTRPQAQQVLRRMEQAYGVGAIRALGADRGFGSAANQALLQARDIYDGICPKSPARLKGRMAEARFVELQRRRSQTDGRIGIFKNGFLGRPLRAKGFEHRERAVHWQVLTHNLWVMARMEQRAALAQAA